MARRHPVLGADRHPATSVLPPRASLLVLAACALLPAACSGPSGPPPVTVEGGSRSLELEPWTSCWTTRSGGGCVDGRPPVQPADIGGPAAVQVFFPPDGWDFEATFRPAGRPCGREQTVDVERGDDGGLRLRPLGPAGTYDVDLVGRSQGGDRSQGEGDVAVTFRWTTPRDGPPPEPEAVLSVLDAQDGGVVTYGADLRVTNLARTPEEASASVTVTSSEGRTRTTSLGTVTAVDDPDLCPPEGSVSFDVVAPPGQTAVPGTPPFRYDVRLVLDGTEHRASALWPRDAAQEDGSSVELDLAPALPAP